jgi:hypothetical protein
VTRVVRLGARFRRAADRLGVVPGSNRAVAFGRLLAALADAPELPGPDDIRALLPPVGDAFVRRVPGRNLWLWYTVRDEELVVVTLTADPPVPVEG